MKFNIETVKGFQDFLPPESLKRQAIVETIQKYFKLYGFVPMETPIVEFDELMRSSELQDEQDEAISDRFRLKDKAGRNLGLRYEFTFQLARILKQNPNLKLPFKRYQIGPIFRDEPTSSSRFRQFTQCDADIIGSADMKADAEIISLVSDILKALKIPDIEIQINNRTLLSSIIKSVEIKSTEKVLKELDKLEKIGEDQLKLNLKKITSANQVITLLKLLEKPFEFYKENAFDGVKEIEELINQCKIYGIKLKFNPYLARGLGYYTGNIFEIRQKGKNSIAAGGRFDNLVGKYSNRKIPAVGVSFGLERLTQLSTVKIPVPAKALVISLDQDEESLDLTKKLRKANVSTILTSGQPSAQLEYANSLQIPYVIFIGEQEVSKKKFKLKNMSSGNESLLSEKQIISKLKV